ncbi:short-chain fatty acids transporter [Natronincola peptidivorans]|uniref:Short-chain fatty acids transporter n=1 Tax=Natronincola peptidivorans TaxID=426128 RepID=A0A1I0BXN0_9FIRM|nr:short-chain fatty acid transporter [Natronincola peptidivorans]SET11788.1 short-chain fatty acids transporter [Natronincola peptidivorans]
MFKKLTNISVKLVQKYLPDPFIFAVILTFIVFLLGMGLTNQTPLSMLNHWNSGFWNLLAFSMQMALVLVTGHTLANAPVIKKTLKRVASISKTPAQAIMLVSFSSAVACWINWGFGLVVGALLAREIAKQVKNVDYRLLIASAYSGFLVWHAGLSASIQLTVASVGHPNNFAEQITGNVIPTAVTIFSPTNLVISVFLICTLPLVNKAMLPKSLEETVVVDPAKLEDEKPTSYEVKTFSDKLENSKLISMLIGAMGVVVIIYHFATKGFNLDLNIVNFIFLFSGIILHGTPRRFVDAAANAVKGCSGILIQFPFYAGIMGMMVGINAEGISLAGSISNWFVGISNETTFPLFTFLSAGIVNFFVPSGGGQWAVQGPIMMPASIELGVDVAKTATAIAWGDAWTNMIQPFWALPALGIAGLGARDIMGFCLVDLIYSGCIIALGLLLL